MRTDTLPRQTRLDVPVHSGLMSTVIACSAELSMCRHRFDLRFVDERKDLLH